MFSVSVRSRFRQKRLVQALEAAQEEAARLGMVRIAAYATGVRMHRSPGVWKSKLGIRSGRLARGIAGKIDPKHGIERTVEVLRSASGKAKIRYRITVPYAKRHEEGFKGTERVSGHTRRTRSGRRVRVRSHRRKANTPKRPFISPAIKAERSEIARISKQLVTDAMNSDLQSSSLRSVGPNPGS